MNLLQALIASPGSPRRGFRGVSYSNRNQNPYDVFTLSPDDPTFSDLLRLRIKRERRSASVRGFALCLALSASVAWFRVVDLVVARIMGS